MCVSAYRKSDEFRCVENGVKEENLEIEKEQSEGEKTITKGKDKLLSFVNELNIVKCYMYGDLLTKFSFDNANNKFKEIRNIQVKYIGGLGEYESKKLLTEKNIHLKRKKQLRK